MTSRRRSDRALVAGLVVTLFTVFGASAVVVAQQNKALHRLEALAHGAKITAADAKLASDRAAAGAADARALVVQFRPCEPGAPADTPSCKRAAQADALVGSVNEALARGIALHDANMHADLEQLRRILASRSAPLATRPPITAAPRTTTTTVTTTTTAPTTTTTRPAPCPRLPNGRCRP